MQTSDILSIIAILISIGTFSWVKIEEWNKRPRLNIFLRLITYIDKQQKDLKEDMVNILIINDGYSPIIISQCMYEMGQNGKGNIGIYDGLRAPYGVNEIVLPALIKPADKYSLNFLRAGAIGHADIKRIVLIDSRDKEFEVPPKELNQIKEEIKRRSDKTLKTT